MEGAPIWDFDSDEDEFDIDTDFGGDDQLDRRDLNSDFSSKTEEQVLNGNFV